MRFAREALPFVLPFVLASIALVAMARPRWAVLTALLALAILLFFRIPTRRSAAAPGIVLAPANGVVTRIDTIQDDRLGPEPYQRVVTFLSVFNIHVQRSPVAGTVISSNYTPGRKVAAFRADAGEVNENHFIVIANAEGHRFGVRQIAGLLARRVVSYCPEGTELERGELIGLIKFGSRVDLYLPPDYDLQVGPGEKLLEGKTIVAAPH